VFRQRWRTPPRVRWVGSAVPAAVTIVLISIAPSAVNVGDGAFTMTVTGTGFTVTSGAQLNGSARTTTFVNSTTLTVAVPASDMIVAGAFRITVVDGAATSNVAYFLVLGQILGGKGPLLRPAYDHLADLRAGPTGDTLRTIQELRRSIEQTSRQELEPVNV